MSGKRIIEGLTEAVAIAKGEQPAARIHVNGHAYIPEAPEFRPPMPRAEWDAMVERGATAAFETFGTAPFHLAHPRTQDIWRAEFANGLRAALPGLRVEGDA